MKAINIFCFNVNLLFDIVGLLVIVVFLVIFLLIEIIGIWLLYVFWLDLLNLVNL